MGFFGGEPQSFIVIRREASGKNAVEPSPKMNVPPTKEARPVFKFNFRVPCKEYANLETEDEYYGVERVTTVIRGVSYDWRVSIVPYGDLDGVPSFFVGLALDSPTPHLTLGLRGRFALILVRYEGEGAWRKAENDGSMIDFGKLTNELEVPGHPPADPSQPDQALLIEIHLEVHVDQLKPLALLPTPSTKVLLADEGLVPALMASVSAFSHPRFKS